MKYWLAVLLIWLPGPLLLQVADVAKDKGTIQGRVLDEKGLPLSGAKVHAEPLNGPAREGFVRYVETNEHGQYVIDRLAWGQYKVFALKEDSDYPNPYWSFYAQVPLLTATITRTLPVADVQVRLGPRAGILAGSVKNAITGAPVNASIKLLRVASPDKWISTSVAPNYRVLLPAGTEVLLEVSAPGFKPWNPGHPLLLQSGVELRLNVALQPSHDPSLHPSRFLVPAGYEGWLLLEYNVKDAEPAPQADKVRTFRFPVTGELRTSSAGPETGADDEYFYYSPDGTLREISRNYTNGKGMIWGEYEGSRNGVMSQFGFFVGTEDLYKKYQSQATHPGPVAPQ